jgi:translation initiation factor IF-2
MAHVREVHHASEGQRPHQRPLETSRAVMDTFRKLGAVPAGKLEIVLKCDSIGSVEAVQGMLGKLRAGQVELRIIHAGVGAVCKSDLLMALTGSRLVVGFNVGVMPKLDQWIKERGLEVRLYKVIYKLVDDIKKIADSFTAPEPEEKITGRARIIEIFKSSHKGVIVGCEIQEGVFSLGSMFRIISAMGTVYVGKITSLHIEQDAVKEARPRQHAGIKITGFSQVKKGDSVECFEPVSGRRSQSWRPLGEILHFDEK